jgi:ankyrin repeat protein
MVRIQDFFMLIKDGKREEVQQALDQEPALLEARDESGLSPILVALYNGEPELARDFLARGPQLDIFEASAAGAASRVDELLDADRSLTNKFAPDGFTPLGLAAFFKRRDVVALLLRRGADPNVVARHPFKVAPIHSAVADGADAEIVRLLIEAGAAVNVKQRHGWTPLHGAAHEGDLALVRYLVDHGADHTATNDQRKTPADVARERGHETVARFLSSAAR